MSIQASGDTKRSVFITPAAFFISLGAAFIFAALFVREAYRPTALLASISLELLRDIGLTLVVFGLVELSLHLKSISGHFSEMLRGLILEDSYLRGLSGDRLKNLIDRIFQAQSVGSPSELTREGGFLQFFHTNLRRFIDEPYRENASSLVTCAEEEDGFYRIEDVITYTCRASGGHIQKEVGWSNEVVELKEPVVSILVRKPGSTQEYPLAGSSKFKYKYKGDETLYSEPVQGKVLEQLVLKESLREYAECDGLVVSIQSTYRVRKDSLQYWQMATLTKGVKLTLVYPPDRIRVDQIASFIQPEESAVKRETDGCREIEYASWVFPDSGLSWKFSPKEADKKDSSKQVCGGT
jgi:hypothetical protein